jgi:CRP/FNR family transcriptional regulator, cyclic AMP receptor protein
MARAMNSSGVYEDPLTHLPHKSVQEFARGQQIYSPANPAACLYLVILGRVKVSTAERDGNETVARIVGKEGLFGEASLIGAHAHNETATALDNVTLMGWTRTEIEAQIERDPRLGVALAQYLIRECLELQDRMESMVVHRTPERVMLALLQLASNSQTLTPDGFSRVASLTHQTIAEFVGTSREIVTFQLNRLRKLGLIRYSRKFMDIDVARMREILRKPQGASRVQTMGGS